LQNLLTQVENVLENRRESRKKRDRRPRIKRVHDYYSYTGFYSFLGTSLKRAVPPIIIFVAAILGIHYFVYDLNDALDLAVQELPNWGVLVFFYLSESILGLVPPELFIAWSGKTTEPITNLIYIAILSYLGGMTSYFIGRATLNIPSFHYYMEVKMAKQISQARKWGGILIAVGALLPLPFAISSLVAGMIKFPFIHWVLYGLLRFVRYALYGWAIFNMV
jgi:membrane protein YqaA with SNARE-associated domain